MIAQKDVKQSLFTDDKIVITELLRESTEY